MKGFSLSDDQMIGLVLALIALGCFYGAFKALYPPPRQWILGILGICSGVFVSFFAWVFLFWRMTRLF